jgi:hypothetical protein
MLLLIASGVAGQDSGTTPSTLIPGHSIGDRIQASFFTLTDMPISEAGAKAAGWTLLGSGCNAKYGFRYSHPDVVNMVIGFDKLGQVATLQFISPVGYPVYPQTTTNPEGLFFEADPDVPGQHLWTVHTSDPDTICWNPTSRAANDIGDRVWLRLVNAMEGQFDKIPLNLADLTKTTEPIWTPFELVNGHSAFMIGGCTPAGFLTDYGVPQGMGLHMQNARLHQDGYPMILLYGADDMLINILAIWSTSAGATPVWPTTDGKVHAAGSKYLEYPGSCAPGGTVPSDQMPPESLPPLMPHLHMEVDGVPPTYYPAGLNLYTQQMEGEACGDYSLATLHVFFNDAVTATEGCSQFSAGLATASPPAEDEVEKSIADLPPCNQKPPHAFGYKRSQWTPKELLEGGKFTALRPRSDWITVHDFDFPPSPPGQSHAAVFTEMGAGVGGAYANAQMCVAHGAPAGCPDLRLAFGAGPVPFDWSKPEDVQRAITGFNRSLSPICNTVRKKHGPMRLDILDLCLETDLEDDDYWYLRAMMDFEMTRKCQGAPASCRLVKMGKPTGKDPTYWEESWDTWGALDYNDTHVIRASWAMCPTEMRDPNKVPCNFGSLASSTNCDAWFAPNTPPPKRDPPEPWLPDGLRAHPTGPSVIAHFCGTGCEYDGEVPPMPPKSAHPGDGRQTEGPGGYGGCPAGCRPAGPRSHHDDHSKKVLCGDGNHDSACNHCTSYEPTRCNSVDCVFVGVPDAGGKCVPMEDWEEEWEKASSCVPCHDGIPLPMVGGRRRRRLLFASMPGGGTPNLPCCP